MTKYIIRNPKGLLCHLLVTISSPVIGITIILVFSYFWTSCKWNHKACTSLSGFFNSLWCLWVTSLVFNVATICLFSLHIIYSILLCEYITIYPGCHSKAIQNFYFWAIMKSAMMNNIIIHSLVVRAFLLGIYLRVEFQDHRVCICSNLIDSDK